MAINDDVVIRRAVPNDAEALGRLGAMLVRVHHEFDEQRFMAPGASLEAGYAGFLVSQLDAADVGIFVAQHGEQVVGYVYAGIEPRSWKELRDVAGFIHDIVVMPQCRGLGIAKQLVETAATWLAERGVPRVMLWTAERNLGAQRLFERLGFRRTMIEMTREVGPR